MKTHAWHDVEIGKDAPKIVRGIIEIPKNCRAKYEMDKQSGLLKLDRVLYSSINYPANYGFIPQTFCGDGDPLDILVLSQIEITPMCIVEAKVLGVMRMIDGGEKDDKIIAVAANDMSVNHFNELEDLPEHASIELRSFFEDYKKLENKSVSVDDFQGRQKAMEVIEECIELYNQEIRPKLKR